MSFKTIGTTALLAATALFGSGCETGFAGYGDEGVHDDHLDSAAAFARMKTLAGSYDATSPNAPGTTRISYEVTSGGHALLEKLAPEGEAAMTSVYHLEGKDLVMVHYCSVGNRPHLRLDRARSTLDDLRFEWDGTATDIDVRKGMHIHGGRIRFTASGDVETEWDFWKQGRSEGAHTFLLSRTAPAATEAPTAAPAETAPPATNGN